MKTDARNPEQFSTNDLILRIQDVDGKVHEAYVSDGLSLGRSDGNDIRLLEQRDKVKRVHARVEMNPGEVPVLKCVDDDAVLLVRGIVRTQVDLIAGVQFSIGAATVTCSKRSTAAKPVRGSLGECPFCGDVAGRALWKSVRFCPSCDAPIIAVPSDDLTSPIMLPTDFGEFVADELVARGRIGLFLRGRHRNQIHRSVAMKVLLPNGEPEQRPGTGHSAMQRVLHPNVVRLLGHGRTGKYSYLVLDWVGGGTLQQIVKRTCLEHSCVSFTRAFHWFHDVAKGLAAIHSAGLIHRQIKPGNILLHEDGRAVLADFGSARAIDLAIPFQLGESNASNDVRYLAPEQLHPADPIDCRADLYSLGTTFYEVLTSSLPGPEAQPISEINRTVPSRFDELIRKLRTPRRQDRFENAQHLLSVLTVFTGGGREWNVRVSSDMIHAERSFLPPPQGGVNRSPGPRARIESLQRRLKSPLAVVGTGDLLSYLDLDSVALQQAFQDIGIAFEPDTVDFQPVDPEHVKSLLAYLTDGEGTS